jgi:dTDP-glucose 4,6-dehydratase
VIVVNGDGTPLRSYLHPIDLCTWLWALLARGTDRRAYNVGSEHAVSIAELAELIAAATRSAVDVRQTPTPGAAPARYVPSTERARSELGLIQRIDLREAIERTLEWHRTLGIPQ